METSRDTVVIFATAGHFVWQYFCSFVIRPCIDFLSTCIHFSQMSCWDCTTILFELLGLGFTYARLTLRLLAGKYCLCEIPWALCCIVLGGVRHFLGIIVQIQLPTVNTTGPLQFQYLYMSSYLREFYTMELIDTNEYKHLVLSC